MSNSDISEVVVNSDEETGDEKEIEKSSEIGNFKLESKYNLKIIGSKKIHVGGTNSFKNIENFHWHACGKRGTLIVSVLFTILLGFSLMVFIYNSSFNKVNYTTEAPKPSTSNPILNNLEIISRKDWKGGSLKKPDKLRLPVSIVILGDTRTSYLPRSPSKTPISKCFTKVRL
jgi:hypothetical protein